MAMSQKTLSHPPSLRRAGDINPIQADSPRPLPPVLHVSGDAEGRGGLDKVEADETGPQGPSPSLPSLPCCRVEA